MEATAKRHLRPRLGDLLVDARIITREQLDLALREQTSWGGRLGQNLLSLGFVDEARLATAIAAQLGLPTVDLDRARFPADVTQLLPLEVAERYGLMPLGSRPVEGRLLVACFDPTNNEAVSAARRASGFIPELHVATASSIDRAIRRVYYGDPVPTPTPVAPWYTVTRNTMDPAAATVEREVATRVAELEHKVERLTRQVESLMDAIARKA
jgi:type IV pilus assembly protein PilB